MEANFTYVGYVLWGVAGVILLVSLLRGITRKAVRNIGDIVCTAAGIPLAIWLARVLLGENALQRAEPFFEDLTEAAADIPSLPETLSILGVLILRPILFVVLYVLLLLLLRLVWNLLAPLFFKEEYRKKRNLLLGVLTGALTGAILVLVVLMPVVQTATVVQETLAEMDAAAAEKALSDEVIEVRDEANGAQAAVLAHPVGSLTEKLTGGLYTVLSSLTHREEIYSLRTELSACGRVAGIVLPLTEADWENDSAVDTAGLDGLPDAVAVSPLLRTTFADVLSGLSEAWLSGDPYLSVEKPELSVATDIALETALQHLRYTTRNNVVENLRMVCGVVRTMVACSDGPSDLADLAENPEGMRDVLNTLLENDDSTLTRRITVAAGIGILADRLGVPKNDAEVAASFAEEMAALSGQHLSFEETVAKVKELNAKYKVGMSDAECESLACVVTENPFVVGTDGELPAAFGFGAAGEARVCTVGHEQQTDAEKWLLALGEKTGTYRDEKGNKKDVKLPTFMEDAAASGVWQMPSDCVTVERLSALLTDEMLEELSAEEFKTLMSAAVGVAAGENVSLSGLADFASTVSGVSEGKPHTREFLSELVTGALQSETVADKLPAGWSENCADLSSEKTLFLVGNLLGTLDALQSGDANRREEGLKTLRQMMRDMDGTQADALVSLCTAETLQNAGVKAAVAADAADLFCKLVRNMEKAKETLSDAAYEKETETVYTLLSLFLGEREKDGKDLTAVLGMNAETLCKTAAQSALLDEAFADAVSEIYRKDGDAFGLRKWMRDDLRQEILTAARDVYAGEDLSDGGKAMLRALCRVAGYASENTVGDGDLWK